MPVQLARNAFLVGKVVVEETDGHAGLGAQVLYRGIEEAPLHEQPERHAQRLHMARSRSEEHTSELQSPCNLVCRLLLEKKKTLRSTSLPGSTSVTITLRTARVACLVR